MRNTLKHTVSTIITLAAICVLAFVAFALFPIRLGMPAAEAMSSDTWSIATLVAPLRAYLFRNALRNTLIVLAVSLPLAYLLGLAAVTLMSRNERSRGVMALLLLVPLAMPVAQAVPAWRQIFLASPALAGGVVPALIAVAVIQAWRLLPFAALFLLLAWSTGRRRVAAGLILCFGGYVIVGDVGVLLLFTGGEPFNATHVMASWIYQVAVAADRPDDAAVLATGMFALLVALSWGFTHFAVEIGAAAQNRFLRLRPDAIASNQRLRPTKRRPRKGRGFVTSVEYASQSMGGVLLASPVIIVLLLPLSVPLLMTGDMARWPSALGELFGQRSYGYWLANTLLLSGITALVTVAVAIPVGQRMAARESVWSARLSQGIGILGMSVLPVAFLTLACLQSAWPLNPGRWLLALVYVASTLCIGIWLVATVCHRQRAVPQPAMTNWLVLLSYLLVTNEMASALVLSSGATRAQSLSSGMPTRLAADVSVSLPAMGAAILLPFVLLLILYWWLVRSAIAPLIDVRGASK